MKRFQRRRPVCSSVPSRFPPDCLKDLFQAGLHIACIGEGELDQLHATFRTMLACARPTCPQSADFKGAGHQNAAPLSPATDLRARQDADASSAAQPDPCSEPGAAACYAPRGTSGPSALPVFDLAACLQDCSSGAPLSSPALAPFCEAVARCLEQTGCLVVRDPRVGSAEADRFLDLMERYFGQPDAAKMPDVHPELHYQVRVGAACFMQDPPWPLWHMPSSWPAPCRHAALPSLPFAARQAVLCRATSER